MHLKFFLWYINTFPDLNISVIHWGAAHGGSGYNYEQFLVRIFLFFFKFIWLSENKVRLKLTFFSGKHDIFVKYTCETGGWQVIFFCRVIDEQERIDKNMLPYW